MAALGAVSPVTRRGRGSLPYHLLSGRGFVFTLVYPLTWNGLCPLVPLIWFPKSLNCGAGLSSFFLVCWFSSVSVDGGGEATGPVVWGPVVWEAASVPLNHWR